jgi:hypothetical protein
MSSWLGSQRRSACCPTRSPAAPLRVGRNVRWSVYCLCMEVRNAPGPSAEHGKGIAVPPADGLRCGTEAGSRRHRRHDENVCLHCRVAQAEAERKRRRHTKMATVPTPLECSANRHDTLAAYDRSGCRCPAACELKRRSRNRPRRPREYEPAIGTQRRLRALQAIGWPMAELARRLEHRPSWNPTRRGRVTAATGEAVRELYDKLWDQLGPSVPVRRYAERQGWPPPMAWDDDHAIENPSAKPVDCRRKDRKFWSRYDLAAEARDLIGLGLTPDLAAERLGVQVGTMTKAIRRAKAAPRRHAA